MACGILGAAVIGYAAYSFYKQVIRKRFAERLDAAEGSSIVRLGQVGYIAQSLVYAVVGYFFIQAAIAFKSTTAKGPAGALIELGGTPRRARCCCGSSRSASSRTASSASPRLSTEGRREAVWRPRPAFSTDVTTLIDIDRGNVT
jgi:hypothetical protein